MRTIIGILIAFSFSACAQDCVDLWQFFDGYGWVSVESEQVVRAFPHTVIKADKATYYNVPVRKVTVCNNKGEKK